MSDSNADLACVVPSVIAFISHILDFVGVNARTVIVIQKRSECCSLQSVVVLVWPLSMQK